MDQTKLVSSKLNIPIAKVNACIELLDSGNTLAFIARYRKEVTGNLDEEQIRQISDNLNKFRKLDIRRKTVLKTIRGIGKLDRNLEQKIIQAENLTELEDLYLAFKPKRKTKANEAREKGLEGLANLIIEQPLTQKTLKELTAPFLGDKVKTVNAALEGARFIVSELISNDAGVRQNLRFKAGKWAKLRSEKIKKAADDRGVYKSYYDFNYKVIHLRPHQILAINRGEKSKILRVKVEINDRDWKDSIHSFYKSNPSSPLAHQLNEAIEDAASRLLLPTIGRDIRRELKEKAENHAIDIFAKNLRALLSQAPLSGHTILGLDPGYRTGCKLAIVDSSGKVLEIATIYPHKPQSQNAKSIEILSTLISKHKVSLVAIGNGTASKESEELIADLIKKKHSNLKFIIVSEAGASVYSASKLARAELPDMDVSIRGAVSIARRVQDPLAELVKIDPKSIGVGLYQHDLDQKKLSESLKSVVESVVNHVGVDLSTASVALLTHVSGIGKKLAQSIVEYRNEKGFFVDRQSLKNVSGLGSKAFEQAAGFIRIRNGNNPLDTSGIHPESYKIANKLLKKSGTKIDTPDLHRKEAINTLIENNILGKLSLEFLVNETSLLEICKQLKQPLNDPRSENPKPILKNEVLKIDGLIHGLKILGTVRNVVDFGAFIDIGVKQDGLIHISQIPKNVKLTVGNIKEFEIEKIDLERGRISLLWVEN